MLSEATSGVITPINVSDPTIADRMRRELGTTPKELNVKIQNSTQATVWLTATEVCERLPVSVSVQTLRRWRKAKLFPAPYRIGGRRVAFREEDIAEWLERLEPALLECWNNREDEDDDIL